MQLENRLKTAFAAQQKMSTSETNLITLTMWALFSSENQEHKKSTESGIVSVQRSHESYHEHGLMRYIAPGAVAPGTSGLTHNAD